MSTSKIIFIFSITFIFILETHASRIKKDLLSSKESEIVTLIQKKIAILDKLLIEASIYKQESDSLIQNSFFNTQNFFLSIAKKDYPYVHTGIGSSVIYDNGKIIDIRGHTQSDKFDYRLRKSKKESFQPSDIREILSISMYRAYDVSTSFCNNIHFVHLLVDEIFYELDERKYSSYKKEIKQMINTAYLAKFEKPATTMFEKYHQLITKLSVNNLSQSFSNTLKSNPIKRWCVHSRMFIFGLSLKKDKYLNKKIYQASSMLKEKFQNLSTSKSIIQSDTPEYYDKEIDDNLQCLESADKIKYRGRICINPIDVDRDIYFKYGTFESRENSFIQLNANHFKALVALDEKLHTALDEYLNFLLLKASSNLKISAKKDNDVSKGL